MLTNYEKIAHANSPALTVDPTLKQLACSIPYVQKCDTLHRTLTYRIAAFLYPMGHNPFESQSRSLPP
jgi:hypothetical protein